MIVQLCLEAHELFSATDSEGTEGSKVSKGSGSTLLSLLPSVQTSPCVAFGARPIVQSLVALAGSATTAVALALFGRIEWPYVLLGWVAFVPWFAALDRMRTVAGALACGLLASELFVAALFPWIPRAISDYSGASPMVAIAVTVAIAPLLQPQFIAGALGRHAARRLGADAVRVALVAASAYVAADGLLPKLFADTAGHGLYASPLLRQAADLGGAHGLTFLLLLVNDAVLAALRARTVRSSMLRPIGCALAVPALLAAYGAIRQVQFGEGRTPAITVAIVQGNVSHYDRLAQEVGTYEAVRRILAPYFDLSGRLLAERDVDLLVWPETVYPTSFGAPKSSEGAAFDRALGGLVMQSGVPLLFGTYEREREAEFNVAVLLEAGKGQVTFDSYRKTDLFPFTEYLPHWLDKEWVRSRLPWAGRWTAGSGAQVLRVTLTQQHALLLAPLICYDAIDPGLVVPAIRQGAELIATLSNDSWFAYPGVQRLILIVSAFRSIETRRPQLRATPTGISAVISATGELTDFLGADQRGTIVTTIQPSHAAWTPVVALGNWFPPAALVAGIVVGIASAPAVWEAMSAPSRCARMTLRFLRRAFRRAE